MKHLATLLFFLFIDFGILNAQTTIPANNPYIQYYGRWDMSDSTQPTHGWPGVYMKAVFQGTSIGVITDDNSCWYNVFIDDSLVKIFKGMTSGKNTYTLASGLTDSVHTILFTLRGETSWTKFGFYGFVLDSGKGLVTPPAKPTRKIEFIGDSYTCASGNEWTENTSAPTDSFTNIYMGFGPVIARHYGAQYMMTSHGGIGLAVDYLSNYSDNLPAYYDRTFFYTSSPKWNYSSWVPNLVVICLGLNDYNGWGGYSDTIPSQCGQYYRTKYHNFIATVMGVYEGAKILCVSPNGLEWLNDNIQQVVQEEHAMGHTNVFYGAFPLYPGTYVNSWHPTVAMHQHIADTLISVIDTMNAWAPYVGTTAPTITGLPSSPTTTYSSSYTLTVTTNAYATMRYSTSDKSYNDMENTFTTTGTQTHSVVLSCQNSNSYTYYLRCRDMYGNAMDTSAVVTIVSDTTKTTVGWTSLFYDQSGWSSGTGPLGSGDSIATNVGKVITAYYRFLFTMDSAMYANRYYDTLVIKVKGGAVVYLNGIKIATMNLSANTGIKAITYADDAGVYEKKILFNRLTGYSNYLNSGTNLVAVEVHTGDMVNRSAHYDSYFNNSKTGTYAFTYGSSWSYFTQDTAPAVQYKNTSSAVETVSNSLPEKTDLFQSYPNPFNPTTTISYQLSSKSSVTLKVYDLLGKEITTLVNEQKPGGSYNVQWNAGRCASGLYFVVLRAGSIMKTTKLMLVK